MGAVDRLMVKLGNVRVGSYVRKGDRGKLEKVGAYQQQRDMGPGQLGAGLRRTADTAARKSGAAPAGPPAAPKAPGAPGQVPGAPKKPSAAPGKAAAPGAPGGAPATPKPPVLQHGTGTKDDPIVTSDVEVAAKALGEDKFVQLKQRRQVSTLLTKLSEMVRDATAKGEEAPLYNLCHVSVKGTNLFCVESKGIARIDMPQFAGEARPGSPADKFPKDEDGRVNLSEEFAKYLVSQGHRVTNGPIDASFLRASQNELNGKKVAKLATLIQKFGYKNDPPVWVSNDDYVIDGHHRWAAAVGVESGTGKPLMMDVQQVDMDILSILKLAKEWTERMGILPQEAGNMSSLSSVLSALERLQYRVRLTRVVVPPYMREKSGHIENVEGYTYDRRGGLPSVVPVTQPRASVAPLQKTPKVPTPPTTPTVDAKLAEERRAAGKVHTEADYERHFRDTNNRIDKARKDGLETEKDPRFTVEDGAYPDGAVIRAWRPERAAQQKAIAERLYKEWFDSVPSEGRAIITGGLMGSGKSTVLKRTDVGFKYGVINPDIIKEEMFKSGMVGHLDAPMRGLAPLEYSTLWHEESGDIAKMIAEMAYRERKNLVWDISMSSPGSIKKRIDKMHANGYTEVQAMFAEIPAEMSLTRAKSRWRKGMEGWFAGDPASMGERTIPDDVVLSQDHRSYKTLQALMDMWDGYWIYDTSGPTPKLKERKEPAPGASRFDASSDEGFITHPLRQQPA